MKTKAGHCTFLKITSFYNKIELIYTPLDESQREKICSL